MTARAARRDVASRVPCLLASPASVVFIAITGSAPRGFHMFSATHALMVLAFILIASGVISTGLRYRDTLHQRRFERALGIAGMIIWIMANAYGFLPGVFAWEQSLPIHVCDLAALAGPVVLLQPNPAPWLRAWLYFAGLGLCTHAFITPILAEGPGDPRFWGFWSGHFVILIAALYDLIVRRWRPTWREWRIAIMLSAAYLAAILPLDLVFDWNYAYVGRERAAGTLIEVLGPWPLRIVIIAALSLIAYTALMLPWAGRWLSGPRTNA